MTNRLRAIESLERTLHPIDPKRTIAASKLRGLYETLAGQLFSQFEPTKKVSQRVSRDFMVRLNDWIELFEEGEDRWVAYKSIEYFFFAGNQEFEELYRCAVENTIKPWLIDIAKIDIFSNDAEAKLKKELNDCWPCPATDSLRINGFLHLTGLKGQSLRPDWLSLRSLGSAEKITAYVIKENIRYLVILEDFSGSGGQLSRALKYAAETFDGPILVVPLIICAPGNRLLIKTIKKLSRHDVTYKPISVLADDCLVSVSPTPGEPKLFEALREVLKKGYTRIDSDLGGGAFGWEQTGSLVAMYSNCPNNTPPIFHHTATNWKPLFPRSNRELKVLK